MSGRRWVAVAALVWLAAALPGPAQAASHTVATQSISISIAAGAVPRSQRVVRVPQGTLVHIEWTADQLTTVHLEGYDVSVIVRPGMPSSMPLKAFASGRFAVHAHPGQRRGESSTHAHGRRTLLWLEVHPE